MNVQMFNDAGGDTQEVIYKLFRAGFTKEELVGTFYLQESDVAACLDEMDDDEIAAIIGSTATRVKANYHLAKEKIIQYMNSTD